MANRGHRLAMDKKRRPRCFFVTGYSGVCLEKKHGCETRKCQDSQRRSGEDIGSYDRGAHRYYSSNALKGRIK